MKLPDPPDDTPTLDQLRALFAQLPADRAPDWGQMDASRMLEHCRRFNDLCLGRVRVGRGVRILARLIGPMFIKRFVRNSALRSPRSLRTLDAIRVVDPTEIEAARAALLNSIDEIAAVADGHRHPLYGSMRAVDVRNLARHHMAHHAHQFRLW